MSGLEIDRHSLEQTALTIVGRLQGVARNHERTFSPNIQAVFVLSGPGTYYEKLKPGQDEWKRWMDRDRILAGVAVAREVALARKVQATGENVKRDMLTKADIAQYGPFFVYNGTPIENDVFKQALLSKHSKLAENKVIVISEVMEEDGTSHEIRHTGDQVKSFYQQVANPDSSLFGLVHVALVAQAPDFIRIPFYTRKYNDEFIAHGGHSLTFYASAPRGRNDVVEPHIQSELPRLLEYATHGHLAEEPSPLII